MKLKVYKRQGEGLLLFFLGWGFDETPFLPLLENETYDVAFIYDYREEKLPALPEHSETTVLAWSAGVLCALSKQEAVFGKTIFLGGTGALRHRRWGIPPKIYDATLSALKKDGEKALYSFYKNMFLREEDFKFFLKNKPQRLLNELIEELEVLSDKNFSEKTKNAQVIITEKDRIIPPRSQKNYWSQMGLSFCQKPWGHFPFYQEKTLSSFCCP
ncbi:protein of unknown function DUF452 [Thermodesulfatator indicus DSM 15286]|uniref:Biotin synthesis protein BioC n=1 Tax=Thermodesulfatator indicus (strain DSM 15286 / JCM 11887 / CIR29812) TaxID=667014 RepID=F8ADD6_THEID|nr:pimeloyl-ACP methyl esterase BioG family protein [Thermodesulfatator indicus]AEH45951.1 protein of unknown function DUF452 [Thermodesulfatator indicus DSM 15286]